MTTATQTLRPGFLVSLSTQLRGNVRYSKQTLEAAHVTEEGASRARWETVRTIVDPVEHERGVKARQKAGSLIRGVCAQSAFGLLCPEIEKENLDKAVKAAREVADEFNAGASLSQVSVYILVGRVAPDDQEAIKAINSELSSLIDTMADGVRRLDVKTIREAASKAKDVGAMLNPQAQARVQLAVEQAREAAKKIKAAGEQAAAEVDMVVIRKLAELRTTFLDVEGGEAEIGAPIAAQRSLDLAPLDEISAPKAVATQIDL